MIRAKVDYSKQYKNRPDSLWIWAHPYDPTFVTSIKTLPLRAYDPNSRKWEVPLFHMDKVISAFPGIYIEGANDEFSIPKEFKNLEEYEAYLETLEIAVDYTPKTKMKPHQVEWFNKMLDLDRVLNADPMGLGKTKEYIDVCEYRKEARGYRKVLFICGAKYTWNMAKQISIHSPSSCSVVHGTAEKRLQMLRDFYYSDDYYLIIGYEAAAIHMKELKLLGKNMGFDAAIIDESQKIKNYDPRKSKPPKTLDEPDRRHITCKIVDLLEYINPELLIMGTGTPVGKKAEDVYSTLRLCRLEDRNIWKFRDRYCTFDHFGRIAGYRHLNEIKERLDQIMIRRPKELLHLKEPIPEYIPLRMDSKQRKFYMDCLLQLKKELAGTKAISANQMTKLLRLRQITSNPILLGSDAPSIKEDVLIEMVRNAAERGEKTVVYSMYVEEVLRLVELLQDLNPAHVIGQMTAKKAQSEVDKLQEDPTCKVLIGSLMACKESYDMWEATNVIFLDQSYNWTDNEQAIARVWRLGQNEAVSIYTLYCEGTVDESVFEILINDKRLAEQLVGVEGKTVRTFDPDLLESMLRKPAA